MTRIVTRPELDAIFPKGTRPGRIIERDSGEGKGYAFQIADYKANQLVCRIWWAEALCNALRRGWYFRNVSVLGPVFPADGFRFSEGEQPDPKREESAIETIRSYVKEANPAPADPMTVSTVEWSEMRVGAAKIQKARETERSAGRGGLVF